MIFKEHKKYTMGSHRVVDPIVTRRRIERLFPIFGISRVANVTGMDVIGVPVYMAIRPNSASLAVSQGKGCNDNAAFVSAAMEAIELYHAENITKPLICSSYNELSLNFNLANPNTLARISNEEINLYKKTMWIESRDILNKKNIFVPFENINMNTTLDFPKADSLSANSNGLASGNTKNEAIIHGVCEVIERDAIALWQIGNVHSSKLDLKTIDDEHCLKLIKNIQDNGVKIGIWDCTSDLGIPTFLCKIISDKAAPIEQILPASGSGTHLQKSVALSRAITEAIQSRLTFITGARDDLKKSTYERFINKKTHNFWVRQIGIPSVVDYQTIKERVFKTTNQDLKYLLNKLKENKINQVIVTDLTKKEFNIPVVKITIPGLEEFSESDEIVIGPRGQKFLEKRKRV